MVGRRWTIARGRRLLGVLALTLPFLASALVGMSPSAQAAEPHASPASSVAPRMSKCPGRLTSADDTNVRVWACNDGSGAAVDEAVGLSSIEALYGPMTAFMSHAPLPDSGGVAGGGDTRIDIYLLNAGQSLTREGSTFRLGTDLGQELTDNEQGTTSSGFILLQRALLGTPAKFNSVMAHEFFHVLEAVYNDTNSCPNYWFTEAAAKWAEWYFVPDDAEDEVYPWFTDYFQESPKKSLFTPGSRTPYSDFVWAMFMQQQHGAASIARAWQAMAGVSGCTALNAAVDSQVSFAANFKYFAVENFDSMPPNLQNGEKAWPVCPACGHYQDLSPLMGTAPPFPLDEPATTSHRVVLGPSYPWSVKVRGVKLPQLSAQYDDFVMSEPASVEFNFSGLSNPSDLDVTLIAADSDPGNGSYIVVPVTGTDEKVCVIADNALLSDFFVVLDNHDAGPPAQITGSYTVTARTTCALSLAGGLTVKSTQSGGGVMTVTKDRMHVKLKSSVQGWLSFPPSTGSYSGSYKQTGPTDCPGGTYLTQGKGKGKMKEGDLTLFAYVQPYSTVPYVLAPVLSTENGQGTRTSPCDHGPVTVPLGAGFQCPQTKPSSPTGPLQGSYSGDDNAVVFNCSFSFQLSGFTYKTTIKGTLTASGLFACGLWEPDFCSLPRSLGALHAGTDGRNTAATIPPRRTTEATR